MGPQYSRGSKLLRENVTKFVKIALALGDLGFSECSKCVAVVVFVIHQDDLSLNENRSSHPPCSLCTPQYPCCRM